MVERGGWLLDEVASAGRENLDPAHVERYDEKEDADAAAELALLRELPGGLGEGTTLVDLGAGTGQLTVAAAIATQARIVAVDISPVMLERLRAKVDATGVGDRVEVVQAGFLTYDHRGAPADVVYSRYALHHLPDFWKAVALRRIHDLLRPGGVLRLWDVVYGFEPAEAGDRIEAWCGSAGGASAGEWGRWELEEHVRDEHSTFTWLLEPMIERAGFTIEVADRSADGIFARYVARRDDR